MMAALDLTNQRFGRLVVLRRGEKRGRNSAWICRCDCGATPTVITYNIRNGNTKSCGCLSRETAGVRAYRHGSSKTQEYYVWCTMIRRCTNPRNTQYADYGGRGITVCKRWRESFVAFAEDMGSRPDGGTL